MVIALSIGVFSNATLRAEDEGFASILDKDHTDGWKYIGDGEMVVREGVATTSSQKDPKSGVYWYQRRTFSDFTLKLEFSIDTKTSNSGILVRFPDPGNDYKVAGDKGYEIDIYGEKTGTIVFLPNRLRPTKIVPLLPGEWNECEVTAIGQKYTVKLNGQVVNDYTGNRALTGYIGLQTWKGEGDVRFRNVRIKELPPAAGPDLANGPSTPARSSIEILSEQTPNALEWALAPLDRTTPPDIRRNLMFLRENLLDEAAKAPAASADTYKLGQQLCNALIATLNERDQALVRAGYRASQANANIAVTDQALEARRNFKMSWPQYFREKDQRDQLRNEKDAAAALARQRPAVEWADRGAQIRKTVDALYAQFREAARRSPPPR